MCQVDLRCIGGGWTMDDGRQKAAVTRHSSSKLSFTRPRTSKGVDMRENAVKTKLKMGETVYGILSPIYDPAIVEVAGHLRFDPYILDCEHGAAGPVEAEHFVRACETVGVTPMARVRSTDAKLIL